MEYLALSIYSSYDYLLHDFKHKGWGRKKKEYRCEKERKEKRRKGGGGEIREKWKWKREGMGRSI